jgi:sterol 3beta-glucosyltransferase
MPFPTAWQNNWCGAFSARWSTAGESSHLGLPPHPRGGYFAALRRSTPFLNGFSPLVVPPPPDWPPHIHTTGYWLPEQGDWQPPEALLRFLEAGPPPVFVGFGSMPVPDVARTTKIIVEAMRRCGQRGILHAGWAGLAQEIYPNISSKSMTPPMIGYSRAWAW